MKVVLLYPNILNFTFQNVKNLKYKKFLIDFHNELGNFKQKKITLQNKINNRISITNYSNIPWAENLEYGCLSFW